MLFLIEVINEIARLKKQLVRNCIDNFTVLNNFVLLKINVVYLIG